MGKGYSCNEQVNIETGDKNGDFEYFVEKFDDIRVLKYRLKEFDSLTLQQKKYIFYLSCAALAGRDILWDQNFRYNLPVRKTLEAIISTHGSVPDNSEYTGFILYVKKVFFANGIHHHYSSDKFLPGFSEKYFEELVKSTPANLLPLREGMDVDGLIAELVPVIFDKSLFARKVERKEGRDIIKESASNFYEGVTQKEVESFYARLTDSKDPQPVAAGLNSRVIKDNGRIKEEVYRSGGKYGEAIDKIIYWLQEALKTAESNVQEDELAILIDFYRSGDLKKWDEYNIKWVKNTGSMVDYINGFIEVYDDPLGLKATWESVVEYTDIESTRRTTMIAENAQWFEDHSPVQPEYKKDRVRGIAAKVTNVAMLGGDCYPASPLGINLPNSSWIRKEIGSKSVRLGNIAEAVEIASLGNGFLEEFAANVEEIERVKKFEAIADALHTDLHECVGHASGKLAPGTNPNALKNYASALEEARADLFALYYIYDDKLSELGLVADKDIARTSYDTYIRNGLLTQIVRIKPGKTIEEAHMRNRSAIAHWVYEKGKKENVVEKFTSRGKTYVQINDYAKLRDLFGSMLREIQRIKSEGDYESGKEIIENYGVNIDPLLHREILDRYAKLNLAPYTGFINPSLEPEYDRKGEITDVKVTYSGDLLSQMMFYGKHFSYLSPWLKTAEGG